jgi:multiple sugar transport system permease protein
MRLGLEERGATGGTNVARAARATGAPRGWFVASQRVLGRDWPVAWLFVLPTLALLFGLIGYPIARAVYLSFFNVVGLRQGAFVGLQNYQAVWADETFRRSIGITITYTVWSEIIKLLLGLMTALALHNLPRWGSLLGGLILVPYVIPEVVRALAWRILLDPIFGAANYVLVDLLHLLPVRTAWLADAHTALGTIIGVSVWAGLPFFVILFTAGLKAVDQELYEAAAIDGAGAWRRFVHVTLPGLSHVTLVALLLSTIFTFNGFGLTYLLTGGGPAGATRLYAILAYQYGVGAQRYSAGVAVALSTTPILLVLIVLLSRALQPQSDASGGSSRGAPRIVGRLWSAALWRLVEAVEWLAGRLVLPLRSIPLRPVARRRLRTGLIAGLVLLVVAVEGLPLYFIVITAFRTTLDIQQVKHLFWPDPWTLEHVSYLLNQLPFVRWYANSVLVAVSSVLISLGASSLGAYSLTRLRWRGRQALSAAVLLAYLVPGALLVLPLYAIVVGLHLLNTLAALMLVYPSAVLPFATWLMMGYYRSVPQELEDAALIDGCSRLGALVRVVFPVSIPGILTVVIFTFSLVVNEFVYAITFISSSTNRTLTVGVPTDLIRGDLFNWPGIMAAILIPSIPLALVYNAFLNRFITGFTGGAFR